MRETQNAVIALKHTYGTRMEFSHTGVSLPDWASDESTHAFAQEVPSMHYLLLFLLIFLLLLGLLDLLPDNLPLVSKTKLNGPLYFLYLDWVGRSAALCNKHVDTVTDFKWMGFMIKLMISWCWKGWKECSVSVSVSISRPYEIV